MRIVLLFFTALFALPLAAQEIGAAQQLRKLMQVYRYLDGLYVDEVEMGPLVESAIEGMLEELDPHSAYIGAEDMKGVQESFDGEFSGIGIEFNVLRDTVIVVNTIVGGPAERVGVMPNDRIVRIDTLDAVGFKQTDVPKHLRGKTGTRVEIDVVRHGEPAPLHFVIVRDKIPLNTVDAAYTILTHRVDMEAVSKDASKEDIAKVFSETKYSRLPVYDGDIDNIIGVIHLKDFYTGNGIIDRDISHIIAPAVYVLKNEKISSILKLLQRKKAHVAVVLDEYGGTCGMITMEDILEELVGEIWDEHDEITETVQQTGENSFTVDGAMDMDDFVGYFGIKADTDATSAGGWITEQLGHNRTRNIPYNQNMKVLSKDNHLIEKFRIDRVCRAKAEAGISE